jgi:hypothetical protein
MTARERAVHAEEIMRRYLAHMCLALVLVPVTVAADGGVTSDGRPDVSGVQIRFADCTEFAGLAPVPIANVRSRVPTRYAVSGETDGVGVVVFRSASCRRVAFDGVVFSRTILAQVGVNVVPPTGVPDIASYTLQYASDNVWLVLRLRLAGVDAIWVPRLTYVFQADGTGAGGDLRVTQPRLPGAYELRGPASDPLPADPGFPFRADWWTTSTRGDVLMRTDIANIRLGNADGVEVTAEVRSAVATLLGATSAAFPVLAVRGVFADAVMMVSPATF